MTNKKKKLNEEKLSKVSGGSFPWKQVTTELPKIFPKAFVLAYKDKIVERMRAINPSINEATFIEELTAKVEALSTNQSIQEFIKTEYGINIDDL